MANDYFQAVPLPGVKLNVGAVRLELLNALRKEARLVRRELLKTVATWHGDRPSFDFTVSLSGKVPGILVVPSGNPEGVRKWVLLNEGTRPHPIRARRAPRLGFYSKGFRAKTRPQWVGSGGGQKASQAYRTPVAVYHPGTKARRWTSTLSLRRYWPHLKAMQAAADRGMKKAMKKR